MQEMRFADIQPFVRYAGQMRIAKRRATVCAYDHRLLYVQAGSGRITVNGEPFSLSHGACLYFPAGCAYCIEPQDEELLLLLVNFDFSAAHRGSVQFLPTSPPEKYDFSRQLEDFFFTDAPALNSVVCLSSALPLQAPLQEMAGVFAASDRFSQMQLSGQLLSALCQLLRAEALQGSGIRSRACQEILDYIRSHFCEDLDNQTLAAKFGYHPHYISQLVSSCTGVPLHRYLLQMRIRYAVTLLRTTDEPISRIAETVGFSDANYFSKYFKKSTGLSPQAFRVR